MLTSYDGNGSSLGVRMVNRRDEKGEWDHRCDACGSVNNMFLTPDGRVVCVICRMKELGIDPASALERRSSGSSTELRSRHALGGKSWSD